LIQHKTQEMKPEFRFGRQEANFQTGTIFKSITWELDINERATPVQLNKTCSKEPEKPPMSEHGDDTDIRCYCCNTIFSTVSNQRAEYGLNQGTFWMGADIFVVPEII